MTSIRSALLIAMSLSVVAGLTAVAAAETSPSPKLELLQHWKLGGAGGWDYLTLDSAAHRLYISRGTRVDVVDIDSGQVVGSIPDTQGVHGIALAKGLNRGYTSNGRANSVTVFDLDTLRITREVPVPGKNPDAILFEPSSKRVFTFNGASKDATVLDAASLAIIGTIPLPDKPEFAADDGHGQIFVNIESDPGQLVAIDAKTLTAKSPWTLAGCNSPTGLAIDSVRHRLFSVCDGKVMAITDSISGKQVGLVPIGEHPDAAAYDAKRATVLSSNGEGTLSIIRQVSADRYAVAAVLMTQRGARTMALDPRTGRIYLATADFGAAPPATAENPHPRPAPIADSFVVLVAGER
jgi:DNA-binding beta-propeller fold protein YncE